ncbi:hypothetical protein [Klebsiella sp. C283]|uniref:hypothetical protein n=1 Tax=Klebsiella sp. C283 TaxID=3409937 RepID=UPI0039B7F53D|nr:hypothetical protein [Klebsiella quasipneumoniae]HBT6129247.1 hypothetical protein [Klebsiella quasipneumoniae]HBT6223080.1 hypothetical protein [Klebsiella quasipneumoniae]HBT6245806.1 hypothetical protein [Klebsiella quasipneumoniae]HDG7908529.1 hypothetical protein [Klebsiella quasipneumoniae]
MTDITELAQSLKAAAEKWQEAWGKYDKVEITIAEFIRAANQYESIVKDPANVIELVEALASEKRICTTWRKTAEANSEKLEKAQAKADVYDMLRDDYGLREKGVGLADFVDWQANRIAELESRTVTVKLTDINEYLAEVHDKTLNRAFRLLAEGVRAGDVAAMRAAGIKVEAE